MTPAHLSIPCTDGIELSGRLYAAAQTAKGSVVIAPALGVPQDFYGAMAEFLSRHGYDTITFDYRGCGASRPDALDVSAVRLEQWGSLDADAVLGMASQQAGGRLFLLGHSAGGQLFGLAENSKHLDGLIMVSSLIPWWKSFPRPWNLRVWVLMHLVMPLFSLGREIFPARKLGISSIDVPSGVTRQWSHWGRHPDYFFDPRWGLDLHRYPEFTFPVLVCHIDDDHYAPWTAIRALLKKLPNTRQEIWHVESALAPAQSIGHVNFFRDKMREVYWNRLLHWLDRQCAGQDSRD